MVGRWWMGAVAVAVAACGGAPAQPEVTTPEAQTSAWREPEAPMMDRVTTEVREPMRYLATEGRFEITLEFGGLPVHHTVAMELGALQVADVPTMLFPVGFVKLDPDSWAVKEQPGWARTIQKGFFRNSVGEPVQLSFDVLSLGKLSKAIDEVGGQGTATLTGSLQVEARQATLSFPVQVERTAQESLLVRSLEPVAVDLAELERGDQLAKVREALGVPSIGGTAQVGFEVLFTRTEGDMPVFARTPVTVASAVTLKREVDENTDAFGALQERLARPRAEGEPDMTREAFDAALLEATKRGKETVRDIPVRGPMKPKPE